MPTNSEKVRLLGRTGSDRRTVKVMRLTQSRSLPTRITKKHTLALQSVFRLLSALRRGSNQLSVFSGGYGLGAPVRVSVRQMAPQLVQVSRFNPGRFASN